MSFLGPENSVLGTKICLLPYAPNFVKGPFLALGETDHFAPWDRFFDFLFPSYGRFREGDPPTQQKVLPHLTVGALTDSNSPSGLDNQITLEHSNQ